MTDHPQHGQPAPSGASSPRFGRWMAPFNKLVMNRLTMPVARRLPGFGVLVHTGRRSGKTFRTPVNVFPTPDGFVVALTYGRDSQWLKNVQASGSCTLVTRGREHRLTHAELFHDERRTPVPPPVRLVLRLVRVADFVHLREVDPGRGTPPGGGPGRVASTDAG